MTAPNVKNPPIAEMHHLLARHATDDRYIELKRHATGRTVEVQGRRYHITEVRRDDLGRVIAVSEYVGE